MIDYWCNAFTPDREALWAAVIARGALGIRTRGGDSENGFCEPAEMVKRMDQVGVDTVVLPVCEPQTRLSGDRDDPALTEFAHYALRESELKSLVAAYPGRFVGVFSVNPDAGAADLAAATEAVDAQWCVGLHTHTHSFDRRFDHADYYPYYALCATHDVPFVMQAGTSGGLMPSECGMPISIDRPALYFPEVRFVLSHTGWPWVAECIAMALKFPNVYLGTSVYPPRHWSGELVAFMNGAGRRKCLWGTGFPTVGHRHALGQLSEVDLGDEARANLLGNTARRVFTRLG